MLKYLPIACECLQEKFGLRAEYKLMDFKLVITTYYRSVSEACCIEEAGPISTESQTHLRHTQASWRVRTETHVLLL